MTTARRRLIEKARQARAKAFAPYSNFQVGAALETRRGRIYLGSNVESASYGLTLCAERVAIFKAVTAGEREFRRLAVVAESRRLTAPCGACRQIIWEFCGDIEVVLATRGGKARVYRMRSLLPLPFDSTVL
jgi:cytidine deaminase